MNISENRPKTITIGRDESGAALVVSLIILLVVTLLGVGALETAVVQERMAANAQNKNVVFQQTESVLADILNDSSVFGGAAAELSDAIVRGVGDPGTAKSYAGVPEPYASKYTITYMGENNPFVAEGMETSLTTDIPRRRFELELESENTKTQARSVHVQGLTPN